MTRSDVDALARLLEGNLSHAEAAQRARPLVGLARALQSSAVVESPAPEFKAELRFRLVAEARALQGAPSLLSRVRGSLDGTAARWRHSTRLATATGVTALLLSGGGVAAIATERALPGDLLYPAKLALEDWRLTLASDEAARGALLLTYAAARVDEARVMAEAGDEQAAAQALREADETARAAARTLISSFERSRDPKLLDWLAGFAAQQRGRVAALTDLLHAEARAAAQDVLVALERIEQRVAVVGGCPTCGQDDRRALPRSGAGFDFGDVPPAREPFQACPCAPVPPPPAAAQGPRPAGEGSTSDGSTPSEPDGSSGSAYSSEASGQQPAGGQPPPSQQPPPEPGPERAGDHGGRIPPLPAPVDERGDLVDELITEIIEGLPVDAPELLSESADGVADAVDGVDDVLGR